MPSLVEHLGHEEDAPAIDEAPQQQNRETLFGKYIFKYHPRFKDSAIPFYYAIYGILMGFGMLFPNAELFIIPIPFPVKAKYFVFGYIVLELFLGIFMTSDGVAHFAHLGGMIFGFILIRYWRKKGQIGRYNF